MFKQERPPHLITHIVSRDANFFKITEGTSQEHDWEYGQNTDNKMIIKARLLGTWDNYTLTQFINTKYKIIKIN